MPASASGWLTVACMPSSVPLCPPWPTASASWRGPRLRWSPCLRWWRTRPRPQRWCLPTPAHRRLQHRLQLLQLRHQRQPRHLRYQQQPRHLPYQRQLRHRWYQRHPRHPLHPRQLQYQRHPRHPRHPRQLQYQRQPRHLQYQRQPRHLRYQRQLRQLQYQRQPRRPPGPAPPPAADLTRLAGFAGSSQAGAGRHPGKPGLFRALPAGEPHNRYAALQQNARACPGACFPTLTPPRP